MAPSTAVQLKEEGNALFVKKDFVRAYEKYTEAIAIDGQNAVLYANRSACSYGMGKYLDASRDAQKATQIDPKYAKGWSRLATAHEAALEFTSAVEAWQKALDALPKTDPSPAELKQKEQYAASLQNAQERLKAYSSRPFPGIVTNALEEKQPWVAAEEMLPELQAAGPARYSSSAYVIYFANQEFTEGVGHIKGLKKVPVQGVPNGFAIVGHTEGLTCITNGIMRDMRVLRMDCQDWISKYNDQIRFEAEKRRAWTSDGLEGIQQKALERLKKEGWNEVRPAFSVTVRAWLMRAIFDSELRQAPHVAVERLKETLELLHWGRQVWRDVSIDDKGVIFKDTFVRGVKLIYLEILIRAHDKASGDDKTAILKTILNEAQGLIEDIEKTPPPSQPNSGEPVDPGFVSSFYIYPAAEAHASVGYCFIQLARSTENPVERRTQYLLAIKQYSLAVQVLPPDDEKHCWYLHCTLDPMLQTDTPKHMVMDIVNLIRAGMPIMQRIWANSAMAKQGRDAMLETALRIAEQKCG